MLMRHPDHGWHNASGLEIEEMKKNGWLESNLKEHSIAVAAKYEQLPETVAETPQVKLKGKPGRKPRNPY